MISNLYRRASVIARLTESPAAPHLDAMVLSLQRQGYSPGTIKTCVLSADRFCQWLIEQQRELTEANECWVDRYTAVLPRGVRPTRPTGIPHKHAGGLPHLIAALRDAQVIPPSRQRLAPATEAENWLARYGDHLEHRVGAAWSTRRKCLHYVRRFIEFRFPDIDPDWSVLDASDIVSFLSGQARCGKSAIK